MFSYWSIFWNNLTSFMDQEIDVNICERVETGHSNIIPWTIALLIFSTSYSKGKSMLIPGSAWGQP